MEMEKKRMEEERTVEEVELAKQRCKGVLDRIRNLSASTNITDSGGRTLLKLAHSEFNFLSRYSSSSAPLSVNIGHLEAIVHILEHPRITGVSRVCKPIPLSPRAIRNSKKSNCASVRGVYVDIVCTLNRKPVWIVVSDRKPKYISWYKGHKTKGLSCRVEELLDAAESSQTLKPCSIILFFSNGLSNFVLERLRGEFGASELDLEFSAFDLGFADNLEGDWVWVLGRSYGKACFLEINIDNISVISSSACGTVVSCTDASRAELLENYPDTDSIDALHSIIMRMKPNHFNIKDTESTNLESYLVGNDDLINFDTTTLIALVSGISNDCTDKFLATPESELRKRFKGNYDFVIGQVTSEIQKPILAELGSVISGKRGIICKSVHSEFKELVLMCGGPNEKLRADHLLKCLMIIPDMPSERMMSLPTTRKLAMKNKIVFGTGDRWRAPTLTANMAFVRAISQTGMSLYTLEHRPRALTGD